MIGRCQPPHRRAVEYQYPQRNQGPLLHDTKPILSQWLRNSRCIDSTFNSRIKVTALLTDNTPTARLCSPPPTASVSVRCWTCSMVMQGVRSAHILLDAYYNISYGGCTCCNVRTRHGCIEAHAGRDCCLIYVPQRHLLRDVDIARSASASSITCFSHA